MMMKKMNYLPGLGLGRNQQGISEFPDFKLQMTYNGLGYKGESSEQSRKGKEKESLYDYFMPKTGCYSDKIDIDAGGKAVSGFEMFDDLLHINPP